MTLESESLYRYLHSLLYQQTISTDSYTMYANLIAEYLETNDIDSHTARSIANSSLKIVFRPINEPFTEARIRSLQKLILYNISKILPSKIEEYLTLPNKSQIDDKDLSNPLHDVFEQVTESLNQKQSVIKESAQHDIPTNTNDLEGQQNNNKTDSHAIVKGDVNMSENDKGYNSQYIREDMSNLEGRITKMMSESEKRIHEDRKDMEHRIQLDREKFQEWLKDLSSRQDDRIKSMEDHNKQLDEKIDIKIDVLSSKLDESNKALENKINSNNHAMWALAISTMVGIAAIAVAVFIALFKQ